MADTSRVDPAVLLANLRGLDAMLQEDIPELEAIVAAQGRAEAIATRYHAAVARLRMPSPAEAAISSGEIAASVPAPPAAPPAAPLAAPLRRASPIPRIPADATRLSLARIAALSAEVRGMTPRAALEHLGREEGEVQAADAQKVLAAAGLSAATSSYAHKVLSHSGLFEKTGPGRFRWRAVDPTPAAPVEDASE